MVPSCLPSRLFCGRFGLQETNGWLRAIPRSPTELLYNCNSFLQKWKALLREGEQSKVEAWIDQAKSWVEMFLERLRIRPQDDFFMWSCYFMFWWLLRRWSFLGGVRPWNIRWEGCVFLAWIVGFAFVCSRPACLWWSSNCAGIPSVSCTLQTLLLSIKAGLNLFQKKNGTMVTLMDWIEN